MRGETLGQSEDLLSGLQLKTRTSGARYTVKVLSSPRVLI